MQFTAWSKDLRVTADGTGVVSHVGAALLRMLADRAGLTSLPFLRGRAADARNVELAIGGPQTSVTIALVVGLVLGGLTAGILHARNGRALAAGLAVTTVAVWALAVVATRVPIPGLGRASAAPPIGLPSLGDSR